nr:hypothetical protein [Tanacetum cinerariifolium]
KDDKEGDADVEDDDTESDKDDIYKYKICVRKDEDEEMLNAEVDDIDKEQEVADIMQALKESKKTSKRQSGTQGLSEETGTIPGVPDESTIVSATSSEGIGTKPGVFDEEKDITEENVILEWGSEQESEYY